MKHRRPPIVVRSTLLFLFLAATTVSAQQRAQPRRGGTVVIAGPSDLQSMNSLVNSDWWTSEFINHAVFMPLLHFDAKLGYAPALASSWRLLGDTAVVFNLRRDVRWHDGVRTSAHDVAFTFNRIKHEETAFPNPDYFERWQSAQVVDSFTIRFRIRPHVEPLFGWTRTAIMPRHLLDSIPAARMREAAFNKAPVGNGPFRFASQRANDRWVFEANPDFPRALGGRPYLDRVVWRVIPENTAQVTEIMTGAVDMALAARAEQIKTLAARRDMRAILRPSQRYTMITWNGKRPPLDDARVRRALTMGMNRQQMIDVLRGGYAQVAVTPVPPTHWAADRELAPLPYDPAGARRLLAAAGYRDRDRDGSVENAAGKPLEIELEIAANNAFNRDVAELVRSNLAQIGVRINARPVDFPVMIQDITSPERNFDGACLTFTTDLRMSFTDAFHSKALGGDYQTASYSNPELDRLLDRTDVVTIRAEAARIWARVQRILRDEQPWTFLWWSPDMMVVRERLRGVQMDVRGALITLPHWWVSTSR
ncbi:MAG: ABC transporter substrate-binding protein [Gemmatimonadota bacterium]